MSALLALVGPLRPGHSRVVASRALPGATRRDVTENQCHQLIDALTAALETDDSVAEVVYGPKVVREQSVQQGRGVLIITAFAIVKPSEPGSWEHRELEL